MNVHRSRGGVRSALGASRKFTVKFHARPHSILSHLPKVLGRHFLIAFVQKVGVEHVRAVGDGCNLNEIFFPVCYGIKRLEFFQIFDRWGHVIFQTDQLNHGWDGFTKTISSGGPEVYAWQLSAIRFNDERIIRQGKVVLIR